jgi:cytochrome oxidase assembly protein ShyY1
MGRYRFLLRPRWLLLHALAVLLAVTMVNLGFWQLRRLDEKRAHNRTLDARAALPVVEVGGPTGADQGATADLAYRSAAASGVYRADEEVLVRSRSLEGQPGAWVLTPMRLDDGRALVVNRGWVPANGEPALPPVAAAPTGRVTVRGLLRPPQVRGRFGPRDPAEGRLASLARADLARLQAQVPEPLFPLYVQLQAQDPAPPDLPVLLPAPQRSEGPHLGYAVQWFLFTAVGVTGYGLMIRKTAHLEAAGRARSSRRAEQAQGPPGERAGPSGGGARPPGPGATAARLS